MDSTIPFEILLNIDLRCRTHSKGLPVGEKIEEDWIGIGFSLFGKRLISKMDDVSEIMPPPSTIRIPGVKDWVKGLANIRGILMPILDMNLFLKGKATISAKENRVLVINKDDVVAGLLVEEVFGLRHLKPESRRSNQHSATGSLEPYLDGVFSDDQVKWDVFNIEKLIKHEPFLRVV